MRIQIKKQDITSILHPGLLLEKTGAYGNDMALPGNWLPMSQDKLPTVPPHQSALAKVQLPGVEEMKAHPGLDRRLY